MAEIIRAYRQEVPASRFIGKVYGDADRIDGGFGKKWGEFFTKGLFDKIETAAGKDALSFFEDSAAYVGLMRWKEGEPFQYWIGMFTRPDTAVPEGFLSVDFPAASLGVCWLKGPEETLYGIEDKCAERLGEESLEITSCDDGAFWFFERYACPRFTEPDEAGNVILDICHFIK